MAALTYLAPAPTAAVRPAANRVIGPPISARAPVKIISASAVLSMAPSNALRPFLPSYMDPIADVNAPAILPAACPATDNPLAIAVDSVAVADMPPGKFGNTLDNSLSCRVTSSSAADSCCSCKAMLFSP